MRISISLPLAVQASRQNDVCRGATRPLCGRRVERLVRATPVPLSSAHALPAHAFRVNQQ